VEAHPIYRVSVPLESKLLAGLGTHTGGVPVDVTNTAVGGEEAPRLVVPVPAAVVAFDSRFLLSLDLIWQI
jgi:hypothetical protein